MDHQEEPQPAPENTGAEQSPTFGQDQKDANASTHLEELTAPEISTEKIDRYLKYAELRMDPKDANGDPLPEDVSKLYEDAFSHEAIRKAQDIMDAASNNVQVPPEEFTNSFLLLTIVQVEKDYKERQQKASTDDLKRIIQELHASNPLRNTYSLKEVFGMNSMKEDTSKAQAQIRNELQNHAQIDQISTPPNPTE